MLDFAVNIVILHIYAILVGIIFDVKVKRITIEEYIPSEPAYLKQNFVFLKINALISKLMH